MMAIVCIFAIIPQNFLDCLADVILITSSQINHILLLLTTVISISHGYLL